MPIPAAARITTSTVRNRIVLPRRIGASTHSTSRMMTLRGGGAIDGGFREQPAAQTVTSATIALSPAAMAFRPGPGRAGGGNVLAMLRHRGDQHDRQADRQNGRHAGDVADDGDREAQREDKQECQDELEESAGDLGDGDGNRGHDGTGGETGADEDP